MRDAGGVRGVGYRKCKDGADVDFYTVEGLGHVWPGGTTQAATRLVGNPSNKLMANDVIWEFFSKHPKP